MSLCWPTSPRSAGRSPPGRRRWRSAATSSSVGPRRECSSAGARRSSACRAPPARARAADRQALAGGTGGNAGAVSRPGGGPARPPRARHARGLRRRAGRPGPGGWPRGPADAVIEAGRRGWAGVRYRCWSCPGPVVALDAGSGRRRRSRGCAARRRPGIGGARSTRVSCCWTRGRSPTRRPEWGGGPMVGEPLGRERHRVGRRSRSAPPGTSTTARRRWCRALTGVDTDRLPAERARGMTIELGYAPLGAPGRADAVSRRRPRSRAFRAHHGRRCDRDRPLSDRRSPPTTG